MQLKLRHTQRETGTLSKSVLFCLDARAQLTDEERANLTRYKLYNQVIYNSEASKRALERSEAASASGTTGGHLKGIIHGVMAALRLNITVASLERGHHIECKSLDELLGAEEALMEACQNLKMYLKAAAMFDGREMLYDFEDGEPAMVAHSATPDPKVVAPQAAPLAQLAQPSPTVAASAFEESQPAPYVERLQEQYQAAVERPNDPFQSFIETLKEHPEIGAIIIAAVLVLLIFSAVT